MSLNYLEKGRDKRRQAGMTTLGLIILVLFVGLFAFAGIRLTPVYLNYMKVIGVVDGVHKEFDGAGASRSEIRNSISRRFDIESVGVITAKDVKVTAVDGGFEVAATYPHKAPFIANISFVVDFDKRVIIRR
ncbi:MAG: DUF4845 domain-containing protein [Gammaproteobacteria bacterium]|nr:DUF4845 domain-containing protein [Gammaproteobacteria bacterium]